MRHLLLGASLGVVLAWGAFAPSIAAEASGATTTPTRMGAWGFDLTGRDTSVSPGADFFEYANGDYLKTLVIPPDRVRYGVFDGLTVLSENRVHAILDAAPLAPDLAAIRGATDRTALAALMGAANRSFYDSFFRVGISADARAPTRYAVRLGQGGLGLPDRDYYLEASFAAKKAAYQAYVAQTLKAVNWPEAEAQAGAIVALETAIAQASWTRVEGRDPVKTYNAMSPAELAAAAPGFDWKAYLAAADLGAVNRVVVAQNTALPKIAAIFAQTPIDTLRAWQAFHVVDAASPYLSKRFADANFEFRNKTLSGQPEQRPRWKRAEAVINRDVGEAVGRVYVERYFTPEAKARMEALIADLRVALAARIENVSWMSPRTKAKALQKLAQYTIKVAYPATWRDYSALTLSPTDLYGDVDRAAAFEWARHVNRLNQPVDRAEWGMTPQTVNAYYNSTMNEIVFPAAILQPPFFDPGADMAVNFGGIGGVIGHEMTHGFDDQGRRFDGTGALADWWTAEDAAKFTVQAQRLGAQYSAFEPIKGAHVNGGLTMGENIADLGGLLLALDAYHLYLKGRPAPVLDGLTGDQRVFLGWAQVWRGASRDDALRQQLVTDPHSPPQARVDIPVRNIDAWYAAFGVKPGDAMYIPPDQRVRIW